MKYKLRIPIVELTDDYNIKIKTNYSIGYVVIILFLYLGIILAFGFGMYAYSGALGAIIFLLFISYLIYFFLRPILHSKEFIIDVRKREISRLPLFGEPERQFFNDNLLDIVDKSSLRLKSLLLVFKSDSGNKIIYSHGYQNQKSEAYRTGMSTFEFIDRLVSESLKNKNTKTALIEIEKDINTYKYAFQGLVKLSRRQKILKAVRILFLSVVMASLSVFVLLLIFALYSSITN